MSVLGNDFARQFGGNGNGSQDRADLPKAQTWLNVGYVTEVPNKDDASIMESVFVSLPVGIPLDTQEGIDLSKIRDARFRDFNGARNELLESVQAEAAKLAPGEEKILTAKGMPLAIQLRRVAAPAEPASSGEANVFAKPKLFA